MKAANDNEFVKVKADNESLRQQLKAANDNPLKDAAAIEGDTKGAQRSQSWQGMEARRWAMRLPERLPASFAPWKHTHVTAPEKTSVEAFRWV